MTTVDSCSGSPTSLCFLGSFLSHVRAENVGPEVADVTVIVKYIRKSVFWHQTPPQFLFRGAMHPPPLPTALLPVHYHLKRLCLSFLVCFVHIVFRSIYVSGKLPTYPSPKSTLTLTSHLGQNVGLGKG